jgi:hypothetical protein
MKIRFVFEWHIILIFVIKQNHFFFYLFVIKLMIEVAILKIINNDTYKVFDVIFIVIFFLNLIDVNISLEFLE